jgi:hypothetical protein
VPNLILFQLPRNTTEIRERVLAEFGEQMNKLGIRINAKLN